MDTLIIRPMHESDLDFAAHCTDTEGWVSETRREFEGFFGHTPGGCLIAELDDQPVGIGVATYYGGYGFIGELIVEEAFRGRGIGRRMMDRAIEYLRQRGSHSIYLDGVLAAVPLYERVGFRKLCRSLRFIGELHGQQHEGVRLMQPADLDTIAALDQEAFGADRRYFLQRRLHLFPALCQVQEKNGRIQGYIFGRRGDEYIAGGPWLVQPEAENPLALIESLALHAAEGVVMSVGVLEHNTRAVSLIRTLGLEERATSPWRMVLGPSDRLGNDPRLFGNGSAAKG